MTWADNLNQLAPSDGQRPRGSRYTRDCAADRTEIRPPATKPRRPKPYPARPHVPAAQASEAMPRSGREVFSAKSRRRWRPRAAAGGHSPKRACRPRRGPSAAAPLAKPGKCALSPSLPRSAPALEVLRLHWRRPHALRSPPIPHVSSARPSAAIHYCVGGVAPTYRVFRSPDLRIFGSRPGFVLPKRKAPQRVAAGLWGKNPGDDLLSHARCTLPSARARFTSEFGMESGGSTQLLSPGRGWRVAGRSDGVIPWE